MIEEAIPFYRHLRNKGVIVKQTFQPNSVLEVF